MFEPSLAGPHLWVFGHEVSSSSLQTNGTTSASERKCQPSADQTYTSKWRDRSEEFELWV